MNELFIRSRYFASVSQPACFVGQFHWLLQVEGYEKWVPVSVSPIVWLDSLCLSSDVVWEVELEWKGNGKRE